MELYALTKDLEIGKVDYICTCSDCLKKGKLEANISYINGEFMMSEPLEDIEEHINIIGLSERYEDLVGIKNELQNSSKLLVKFFEKQIINEFKFKNEKEND